MRYDADCCEWVDEPEPGIIQECEDGGLRPFVDALTAAIILSGDAFCENTDRDPVATAMPYRDYLASPHWLATRQRARLRAGGMCQRCYATGRVLDVHHLTYARLGREAESDLIVLCRQCHGVEHGVAA